VSLHGAARVLFGVAAAMEERGASPLRVRAYRRAARGLLRLAVGGDSALRAEAELRAAPLLERLRAPEGQG
jgi:DNA polymerase/3'-5' exonuclease PolX